MGADASAAKKVGAPQTIHLRAAGQPTGYKIKRPATFDALLRISSNLVLQGNATKRIFDRSGDVITDMDVVASGDVLYASSSGTWLRPPDLMERPAKTGMGGSRGAKAMLSKEAHRVASRASSSLAEALLQPELRATPVRRADETPARLCSGRPPYGLMGDPTQLGTKDEIASNYSKLRGAARQQAHVALCVRTARRMQARNLEAAGGRHGRVFPPGSTCAIVGSSGSLMRSHHGPAIDAHDMVMRFNLAPAGGEWGRDVGNRTTIRILTDKVVAPYFASRRASSARRTGRAAEPDSTLLLYCMAQGWVGKCMHEQRLGHVNPVFIRHLRAELDRHHGRGRLPSAGIAGIAMAISHCSKVSLYGFGNASDARLGANGTGGHAQQCGHYWDCKRQQGQYFAGKQGYHDWNAQWAVLSSWIEQIAANASLSGALRFIDGVAS